jgi:hypothetical protein
MNINQIIDNIGSNSIVVSDEELIIGYKNFTTKTVTKLIEALKTNTNLKKIIILHCYFSRLGSKMIKDFINSSNIQFELKHVFYNDF